MAKDRGGESYSARLAAARQKAINYCADFFEASGVEYTCLKVVMDTVAATLASLANLDEFRPYNVNTTRTLQRIADEVHKRWRQRECNQSPDFTLDNPASF